MEHRICMWKKKKDMQKNKTKKRLIRKAIARTASWVSLNVQNLQIWLSILFRCTVFSVRYNFLCPPSGFLSAVSIAPQATAPFAEIVQNRPLSFATSEPPSLQEWHRSMVLSHQCLQPARWLADFGLLTFISVLQWDAPTTVLGPWDRSSTLVSLALPRRLRGLGLMMPPNEVPSPGSNWKCGQRGTAFTYCTAVQRFPPQLVWWMHFIHRKIICGLMQTYQVSVSKYFQGLQKTPLSNYTCYALSCLLASGTHVYNTTK